jgi:NADH-quinone oxidoreductase subunit A
MPSQYIPILIVALVAAIFPLAVLAILKRAKADSPQAQTTDPVSEISVTAADQITADRNSVKFHMAAALFVIFAAAIALLFPWSIQFSQMGVYGLVVMLIFLGVLLSGYAWLYKKGALDWI